jgi:DNA-binding Lrp family transcriptional regulator
MCYAEKKGGQPAKAAPAAPAVPVAEAVPVAGQPVAAQPARPAAVNEDEPLSLVEEQTESASMKIQTFGQTKFREHKELTRKTSVTGQGATRVRTFHAKIQAESIEFMDEAINLWLDEHPEVEVKFATTTVGTMAGKFPEPNIIMSIWY